MSAPLKLGIGRVLLLLPVDHTILHTICVLCKASIQAGVEAFI